MTFILYEDIKLTLICCSHKAHWLQSTYAQYSLAAVHKSTIWNEDIKSKLIGCSHKYILAAVHICSMLIGCSTHIHYAHWLQYTYAKCTMAALNECSMLIGCTTHYTYAQGSLAAAHICRYTYAQCSLAAVQICKYTYIQCSNAHWLQSKFVNTHIYIQCSDAHWLQSKFVKSTVQCYCSLSAVYICKRLH